MRILDGTVDLPPENLFSKLFMKNSKNFEQGRNSKNSQCMKILILLPLFQNR